MDSIKIHNFSRKILSRLPNDCIGELAHDFAFITTDIPHQKQTRKFNPVIPASDEVPEPNCIKTYFMEYRCKRCKTNHRINIPEDTVMYDE